MKQAIICHGFLSDDQFGVLDELWPEPPLTKSRSHHDIAHSSSAFLALPMPWQHLRDEICSAQFWERVLPMFPDLRDYQLDRFDPDAAEGHKTFPRGDKQYPRLDLGWGSSGYGSSNGGRGNHIDNFNRVVSGLLYFTDQSEMEGGEFELTEADGSTFHQVPIRKNLCIMSVQNDDGWHRVNPLKRVDTYRRSVYFALSDTRNIYDR